MIKLKDIEINDKKWIDPLIAAANFRGCHQNFTNMFAWTEVYKYEVAQVEGFLVVKENSESLAPHFYFPAGTGDLKSVIETMKADAEERQHPFSLIGLSVENVEALRQIYPDRFEYQALPDIFDYVYRLDKLVSLSGKKLQSKRNHINRFKATNPWTFELITAENKDACWEMNVQWCKEHGCGKDPELANEKCAVRRCFDYYWELGLEGGLLRVDGKVIAYTMGERLNADTYDIHIEKAFPEIHGSYQMINHEFASHLQEKYPDLVYVNREEDMGLEGLRKAKLSYYPERMEEKYLAKYIQIDN
ncbi:MAG TPA: hypothetical protein DIT32_00125 [Peptococcaceae bacterium]|nr:hypothetical protein [Peptococcaceae bacterium]